MTIYHNHHFVPRHAGGADDPSNIMRVSVAEHAALHYERWVVTGDELDRVAWKFLVGQIRMSDAKRAAIIEGARRGGTSNAINKTGFCGRSKEKMSIDGRKAASCGPQLFKDKSFQQEMSRRSNKVKSIRRADGAYKELYEIQSRYLKARYTKAKGYVNDGWFDLERGKLQAAQNNSQAACPHCGKIGQYRAMKRWHFDNCKDSSS